MATDGSASAHEAVGVGVELAAEHGAEVTFIHVFPADNYVIVAPLGPALPRPDEVDSDENGVALRQAANVADAAGVSYVLERVSGDTVDEIVTAADSMDADVIVIGSRGRGPMTSALLGSVSRGVLNESSRPVLIVRGAHHSEPAEA